MKKVALTLDYMPGIFLRAGGDSAVRKIPIPGCDSQWDVNLNSIYKLENDTYSKYHMAYGCDNSFPADNTRTYFHCMYFTLSLLSPQQKSQEKYD